MHDCIVRRRLTLLIAVSITMLIGLSPASDAATSSGTRPKGSNLNEHASSCSGQVYPTYEYTQSGYVPNYGGTLNSKLDVIQMPSYDPVGSVVRQWPVGCAPVFGKHFTTYLFVSSGPLRGDRSRLPLANEGPVGSECLEAVHPTADGNDYPLTCSHGKVNVAAWESYAELLPKLLTLGRSVTRCQVYEAEMNPSLSKEDFLTTPEVDASYTLASIYYGWTINVPSPASTPAPAWEKLCASD